jgi:hypothetical protein
MSNWKNSELSSFYRKVDKGSVQVQISGSRMLISYEQFDGSTIWKGEEVSPGHFELTCARKNGRATLHRVPGQDDLIEGYWVTGKDQGMWRIQLKEK